MELGCLIFRRIHNLTIIHDGAGVREGIALDSRHSFQSGGRLSLDERQRRFSPP
jgi:hypothetical protein